MAGSTCAPRVRGWCLAVGISGLAGLGVVTAAWATPPRPPVTVTVGEKVEKTVAEGKTTVRIRVEVASEAESADVRLEVSIRPDRPGLEGLEAKARSVVSESLKLEGRRGRRERRVEVPVPGPGTFEVTVKVSGESSEEGFSDKVIRYLIVDDRGQVRLITGREKSLEESKRRRERFEGALRKDPRRPDIRLLADDAVEVPADRARKIKAFDVPAQRRLQAPPAGPGPELEGFIREPGSPQKGRDPITVRGQMTYLDWDGNWRPLVNVTVNVWDDDTFGDEHLGTVATDWDGNWSLTVDADDGLFQDGRDIYFSAMLENSRLRVLDAGRSRYRWQSGVREGTGDGSVVDFGTLTGSTGAFAMRMWGHLNLAWAAIVTRSGQDPGMVTAISPGSATFWSDTADEIEVVDSDADGPDVLFHEYGHALMHNASGSNAGPGGPHGFGDVTQDAGLAYSEGWATGWMLMVRPDGVFNWHEGDGGRRIESFSSRNRTGELTEGRVAAAFLDFFDSADDTNGGSENLGRNDLGDRNARDPIGLDILYRATMWGRTYDNFLAYWDGLRGELDVTATRRAANEIMRYNWMTVVEEIDCTAATIAARAGDDRVGLLTGLRQFRDLGLRGVAPGRDLTRIYYRNSPELTVRLARDDEARAAAMAVMRHYSRLGATMARDRRDAAESPPVLPDEVEKAARLVIEHVRRDASPELTADLRRVAEVLDKVRGLTLEELRLQLTAAEKLRAAPVDVLDISQFNPGSRRAVREGRQQAAGAQDAPERPKPPEGQKPKAEPEPDKAAREAPRP